MDLIHAIERVIRPALRKKPSVRYGRVKSVDNSSTVQIVSVDGRPMRTLQTVEVDDLVMWLSGDEPVCVGPVVLSP